MKGRVIFLLEEKSMEVLLQGLLPRLFPGWVDRQHFLCIKHEGKGDLDKSFPRKIQTWTIPDDRFVILRDNDGADCLAVKSKLVELVPESKREKVLVRLVCQELESWYLGDGSALDLVFGKPKRNSKERRRRFKDPDKCSKPSKEVARLYSDFQKVSGARLMGKHLDLDCNQNPSNSFRIFISGLQKLVSDMEWTHSA